MQFSLPFSRSQTKPRLFEDFNVNNSAICLSSFLPPAWRSAINHVMEYSSLFNVSLVRLFNERSQEGKRWRKAGVITEESGSHGNALSHGCLLFFVLPPFPENIEVIIFCLTVSASSGSVLIRNFQRLERTDCVYLCKQNV